MDIKKEIAVLLEKQMYGQFVSCDIHSIILNEDTLEVCANMDIMTSEHSSTITYYGCDVFLKTITDSFGNFGIIRTGWKCDSQIWESKEFKKTGDEDYRGTNWYDDFCSDITQYYDDKKEIFETVNNIILYLIEHGNIVEPQYENIIGCIVDTNQFTSKVIEDYDDAVSTIEKLISIYSIDTTKNMFFTGSNRYSAYAKDNGISLWNALYS